MQMRAGAVMLKNKTKKTLRKHKILKDPVVKIFFAPFLFFFSGWNVGFCLHR